MSHQEPKYQTFAEFYPHYLNQHRNRISRRLHFIGTGLVIGLFLFAVFSGNLLLLIMMPVAGYTFAWSGHYFFEKNIPQTVRNPLYSLLGDFVMFKDIISGKIRF